MRKEYDILSPEDSKLQDSNDSLMQLNSGTSQNSNKLLTTSDDRLELQISKQKHLEELLNSRSDVFEQIIDRITSVPYRNTDFEISFVQLKILQECLKVLNDANNSKLLDEKVLLNLFWMEILDMFVSLLESIPDILLHVYVRYLRYTVFGLLNGESNDDPLEYRIVYDVEFSSMNHSRIPS